MQLQQTRKKCFIQIEHVLFDAVISSGFTGRQVLVLFALIRKTIGYQKEFDDISASQIGALCKIGRQHVTSTLGQLRKMRVIFMEKGRYGSYVEVNQNIAEWRTAANALPTSQDEEVRSANQTRPGAVLPTARESSRFAHAHVPTFRRDRQSEGALTFMQDETGRDRMLRDNNICSAPQKDALSESNDVLLRAGCPVSAQGILSDKIGAPKLIKGAADSGQGDRPNMVHTIYNLPKDNKTKQNHQQNNTSLPNAKKIERAFAAFWERYPKKCAKGKAYEVFCRIAPDEALLGTMLQALEQASQRVQWRNPQMIPYPASWLKTQGWLDVLQTTYSEQELSVANTFNNVLGDIMGCVDTHFFVEQRASAMRHFLLLGNKPDWVQQYFVYCRDRCALPDYAGFDWLLRPENFIRVREGLYQY